MIFEYVWLDANENLRSKIKVCEMGKATLWNFDGSSTGQATGSESDIILKPVKKYVNPFFESCPSNLVLCECLNKDMTPHDTNHRPKCEKLSIDNEKENCLFGIEQEYVIYGNNGIPYKWCSETMPINNINKCVQGEFYCGVGSNKAFGREISNKHLQLCLKAGIKICGTNAEVAPSQWEYQIGPSDMLSVSDDLIMSRYILNRIAEEYNCYISLDPKPFGSNWNGSGGHTNFSTLKMRSPGGMRYIYEACEKLKTRHMKHLSVYGKNNDQRLTGNHETSDINNFSYGVGNRSCSIRIPQSVANDGYGYIEDRRPSANLNPYLVTSAIVSTIME